MAKKEINPNSDKDHIDGVNINDERTFPKFLLALKFHPFRHISDLSIHFNHPISVISGTNRSGKSTVLMALACSHLDFRKRNLQNGKLERQTWSSLMKFTSHDNQKKDWTYFIKYKFGKKIEIKKGQRKLRSQKWNGIGKKESQFKGRQVVFIDLDRIMPARNFGNTIFNLAKSGTLSAISVAKVTEIEKYLSYILEEKFHLNKITKHLDKDIFKYGNIHEYSSYNAATGEEVLTKIIIDCVEAMGNALILIDEVEMGLHPKIQRRLIQVLYNIARNDQKQFIITSHSPTILSSLPSKSRVFIEKDNTNKYKSIHGISVSAALSKMDSLSYPLVDLYCEDIESKKIIQKALKGIQTEKSISNFSDLINIIISGSGSNTYTYFKSHKATYPNKKIKTGYATILDGDRRELRDSSGNLLYPPEECLHFVYSNEAPEKFLLRAYLTKNANPTLDYHLNNSDPHCLFEKIVENSDCATNDDAFEECWKIFMQTSDGNLYIEELKKFILDMTRKFSPDL